MQRPGDATDRVICRRDLQPADWQEVEVLVDGVWHKGNLRAWTQRRDAGWWAHVQYSQGPAQTYLDTVPADRISPVELNAELQINSLRHQMQVAWLRHNGHLDGA